MNIQTQATRSIAFSAAFLLLSFPAAGTEYGGVELPNGFSSFADIVLRYDPSYSGSPPTPNDTEDPFTNPFEAIGAPREPGTPGKFVSLGNGGLIELGFTDNILTNSSDSVPDLHVFEIGPTVESTYVAIRPTPHTRSLLGGGYDTNNDGYLEVGRVFGSTASLDIDATFPGHPRGALQFDAVQLVDDYASDFQVGVNAGADIDAVAAVSNVAKKHLVLVAHGLQDSPFHDPAKGHEGWPDQMLAAMSADLVNRHGDSIRVGGGSWSERDRQFTHPVSDGTRDTWELVAFDWEKSAATSDAEIVLTLTASARRAATAGHMIGKRIGRLLLDQGYDSVHLIGHSAGSRVIQGITDILSQQSAADGSRPDIHETFLDAFTPNKATRAFLGNGANWAEHYVHDGGLPLTNETLLNAYNIDLTSLYDETSRIEGHRYPRRWYLDSMNLQNPLNYGWGFQDTVEVAGSHPTYGGRILPGGRCDIQLPSCPTPGPFRIIYKEAPLSVDPSMTSVSDTGQVSFTDDGGFIMTTGSLVSIVTQVEVSTPTDLLRFDYEFASAGMGLLSVYFQDEIIYMAEEEFTVGNESSDWIGLPDLFGPGIYSLRFVLEPMSDIQSSIHISNLEFGTLTLVPEPTSSMFAAFGLVLALVNSRAVRKSPRSTKVQSGAFC